MATELLMPQPYNPRSRPSSVLIPPNPAFMQQTSPRGGILLNSARPASMFLQSGANTPRSPSPMPPPPEVNQLERTQSVYSTLGSRKIRFAPLPEPRRDVMVDEDGAEIPCSATYPNDATAFPVSPGPITTTAPSVGFDRTDSIVTDSGASTNSTDIETQSQLSRKRKRNSLLRLLGFGGSTKHTSTTSLPPTDSNGSILNLFRATSRESSSGEPSGYTSDGSMSRRMPRRTGNRSSTNPNYMLNGRVYGARRANERLQPLPSMEPEFSEWGFGGMGSVNTSSEYSKLQSNTSAVGGGSNDDEDDGSGMAWIKKRKEKKEREEREKKQAEEAAAAAAEAPKSEEPKQRTSTETAKSTPTIRAEPAETEAPQTPPASAPASTMSPPRTQATRTMSPPSRQNSNATVTPDRHHPTVVAVPAHRGRQETTAPSVVTSPESSPERSSGSSRRSSSSDDEGSSGNNRDDEEEEEEENQKRKTALSAGIEKISRHHA